MAGKKPWQGMENLLLSLEALVGLLGIVQPASVVDGDLVTGSR